MIDLFFFLFIVGTILYGLVWIGLTVIGCITGLYYGVKAARKNPHPIELTDWFKEKSFFKTRLLYIQYEVSIMPLLCSLIVLYGLLHLFGAVGIALAFAFYVIIVLCIKAKKIFFSKTRDDWGPLV